MISTQSEIPQSSPSRRIFASIIATSIIMATLWISTFIQGTPSTFFGFVLFNTALIAITSSYLCAAVYAQAALLGPSLLQVVISGEAAIAVAMSVVQVVSAVTSVWGFSPTPTVIMGVLDAEAAEYEVEEVAARIFFGFSALFLVLGLAAYTRLTKQTSCDSRIGSSKHLSDVEDANEHIGLLSGVHRSLMEGTSLVYRILKQNWMFMFSIAYVHTVTLVSAYFIVMKIFQLNNALTSLSTPRSPRVHNPRTRPPLLCSLPRSTSWSLTVQICLDDTSVPIPASSSAQQKRFYACLQYGRYLYP